MPAAERHSFSYDGDRRLTRSDDINGGEPYSYDKSGNLTSITTANGAVTSYAPTPSIESFNRRTRSAGTPPSPTIASDNVTGRTDANGRSRFQVHDPLSRLIRTDLPNDIVTYSYDKAASC